MTFITAQPLKGNPGGCSLDFRPAKEDVLSRREDAAIRILLIDHPVVQNSIPDLLAKFTDAWFILEETDSLLTGLQRLKTGGIDIVLLDSTLGDSNGLQSLRMLRSSFPRTPIIVLAEFGDRASFPEALRMGAKDCIVKGSIDGHLLGRAILRHVK